jgi:hypothetical protein
VPIAADLQACGGPPFFSQSRLGPGRAAALFQFGPAALLFLCERRGLHCLLRVSYYCSACCGIAVVELACKRFAFQEFKRVELSMVFPLQKIRSSRIFMRVYCSRSGSATHPRRKARASGDRPDYDRCNLNESRPERAVVRRELVCAALNVTAPATSQCSPRSAAPDRACLGWLSSSRKSVLN